MKNFTDSAFIAGLCSKAFLTLTGKSKANFRLMTARKCSRGWKAKIRFGRVENLTETVATQAATSKASLLGEGVGPEINQSGVNMNNNYLVTML